MRSLAWGLALVLSVPSLAWAQTAPAPSPYGPSPYGQPPPPQPQPLAPRPPPPEPESRFYGWQIFPGAIIAGGLFVLGKSTEGGDGKFVVYTSAAVVGLAWGPVIHAFNDQSSKMKESMEITVAGATLGLLIGSVVTSQHKPPEEREYGKNILLGIEIGVVSAMVLDGLVLGWKETLPGLAGIRPTVGVGRGVTTFGVAGAF